MFENYFEISGLTPGFAPLVMALCRLFKIDSAVNSAVSWDENKSRISPGTLVNALIVNILCHRTPLWKIEKFYANQDLELMFNGEVELEQLNDDAFGYCLEKLARSDQNNLIAQVGLGALSLHDLEIKCLHEDTTSISVEGEFEGVPFKDFDVTFGNSKDKRPDLKQFMIGLCTQQDGLPVWGEGLKGNTSDKKWNPETVEMLKELLAQKGYQDIIFVADAALVNTEALNRFSDPDNFIKIISRIPDNFTAVKEVKDLAWQENVWQEIGKLTDKKDAASYRLRSFTREIGEYTYRLLVVHSSSLDKRKLNSLQKKMDQMKSSLQKQADELSKESFYCEADAKQALLNLMAAKETMYYPITGTVEQVITEKHPKRGRPKKEEKPVEIITYRVIPQIGQLNQKAFEELKQREATFVLVTNILDRKELSNQEMLITYKNQNNVEMVNRLLKNPAYLGPVYLKNKDRINGLAVVFILALIVAVYLQYRVRKALQENHEQLLIAGGKKTDTPTFQTIKEMFFNVDVFKVSTNTGSQRVLPKYADRVLKIVKLAGFSPEIYTSPHYLASIGKRE
jgi:transposase